MPGVSTTSENSLNKGYNKLNTINIHITTIQLKKQNTTTL